MQFRFSDSFGHVLVDTIVNDFAPPTVFVNNANEPALTNDTGHYNEPRYDSIHVLNEDPHHLIRDINGRFVNTIHIDASLTEIHRDIQCRQSFSDLIPTVPVVCEPSTEKRRKSDSPGVQSIDFIAERRVKGKKKSKSKRRNSKIKAKKELRSNTAWNTNNVPQKLITANDVYAIRQLNNLKYAKATNVPLSQP